MISVIIPANNEAGFIGPCLDALLAQDTTRAAEVIVAANGCTDDTVAIAQGYGDRFAGRLVLRQPLLKDVFFRERHFTGHVAERFPSQLGLGVAIRSAGLWCVAVHC